MHQQDQNANERCASLNLMSPPPSFLLPRRPPLYKFLSRSQPPSPCHPPLPPRPQVAANVVHVLMDFLGDSSTSAALDVVFFVREMCQTHPALVPSVLERLRDNFPTIRWGAQGGEGDRGGRRVLRCYGDAAWGMEHVCVSGVFGGFLETCWRYGYEGVRRGPWLPLGRSPCWCCLRFMSACWLIRCVCPLVLLSPAGPAACAPVLCGCCQSTAQRWKR